MSEAMTKMEMDPERRVALFTSIVQFSEDAIISKNVYGMITSWNQAAQHLLGYNEQEVLGQHISILIPEDRLEEEDAIISSILKGKKITNFKTVRKTKTGRELHVSLTISPMFNGEGKIIGASKILRDITEQVALEQKFQETNLALQRTNIFKDEFIGLLGHELKTPLTSLKACIELMEMMPERTPELITKSKRHVLVLSKMLQELLDMAQSQAGRMEINPARVNVTDFVSSAIEIAQQGITSHHIELQGSCDFGIPVDEIDRIGTRFYRVSTHKHLVKGLGIGLHLCKQLVHAHHGHLWIESAEGEGSCFYVRLPLLLHE